MSFADFRLIAPPHTPFTSTGDLNLDVVSRQAEWFSTQGIHGVFVAGTTGECSSLTIAERMSLTQRWIGVAGTDLEVIVQVGDNCQRHAMELAAHAQQTGADATAALAPSYFKPAGVEELIDFLAPIAAQAGDLPFYFYDIPMLTEVRLNMVEFLTRGKERIPNLAGLKYTNGDFVQLQECLHSTDGQFDILFGLDEAMMGGAVFGANGAVGSSYNYAAKHFQGILQALGENDLAQARKLQASAVAMIRVMQGFGFLGSSKATMKMIGIDCGPVRSPNANLTAKQESALHSQIQKLGTLNATMTTVQR